MTILEALSAPLPLALTSLSFLLVMLPVMLAVYYLLPVRARAGGLLVMSLACYYIAEGGIQLLLLVGCVAADYAAVRLLGVFSERKRLRLLVAAASVTKNVELLAWFGVMAVRGDVPPVFGLQIYALASMGVVLLTYQNKIPVERDPFRFGLYCAFFPALYAGPLAAYETFSREACEAKLHIRDVLSGLGQTAEGAFKTAVLGGSMLAICGEIRGMDPAAASALSAWCLVLTGAFALYYSLSGLSDMARGIGLAFGLRLPRNFYYPYQSRSVGDFFERFNSTVHRWLRDFVRIVPERFDAVNLLFVGLLMGLWFGFRQNYLLWGAYFALWILAEQYVYPGLLKRIPLLFCRIGTFLVVLGGFTIFIGGTPGQSLFLARRMLDFSGPTSDRILYILSSNWLILLVACVFATNAVSLLARQFRKAAPRISSCIMGIIDLGLFVLFLALTY